MGLSRATIGLFKTVIFSFFIALAVLGFESVVNHEKDNLIINTSIGEKWWSSRDDFSFLTDVQVDVMTPQQVVDYFQWSNHTSCQLVHDFGGKMVKNPSGISGQKAVCLEPVQVAPPVNNCIIYSLSISNERSFDEAISDYGCQVYAYPSMKKENDNHISDIEWKLESHVSIFGALKSRHRDRPIDYLKLDIKGSEWKFIPQMIHSDMLDKIRQLTIKIYLPFDDSPEKFRDRVKIIRTLEKNGMVRFDSKLNPWSKIPFFSFADGKKRPFAYDIAWYNSKYL